MAPRAVDLLDDMLAIRELEEMIVRLRSGGYEPLQGYDYRGPTHVSIGQEGTAVGASSVLGISDRITSSHRGHGDAIAKGFSAIRQMDDEQLKARVPWSKAEDHEGLLADALRGARLPRHRRALRQGRGLLRRAAAAACTSATCRPATWAPTPSSAAPCPSPPAPRWPSATCRPSDVVVCFAGDGAYANGVVLESLNWAEPVPVDATSSPATRPYGLPVIYVIQNNHYGMTHRTDDEVMGVPHAGPARRGLRRRRHARRDRQRHGRAGGPRRGRRARPSSAAPARARC